MSDTTDDLVGSDWGYSTYDYPIGRIPTRRPKVLRGEGKREYLKTRIDMLIEQLATLESLPEEPGGTDDGTNVIFWEAVFPSSEDRVYTYVAVKASDGLWYTSGPRSPKGYSWEKLIEWIADQARPNDGWVYVATQFDGLKVL